MRVNESPDPEMDGSTSDAETQLDDLVVRIIELMNQYIVCKVNIENYVRSGCLDLAKARYISGNRSISALQLPTEDALGVRARLRVSSADANTTTKYKSIEYINVEDCLSNTLKNIDLNASSSGDPVKPAKRFGTDPLKWFGVLVPQSLRQSKTTFEKCLEIVVECVNVQLELHHSVETYKQLRELVK